MGWELFHFNKWRNHTGKWGYFANINDSMGTRTQDFFLYNVSASSEWFTEYDFTGEDPVYVEEWSR